MLPLKFIRVLCLLCLCLLLVQAADHRMYGYRNVDSDSDSEDSDESDMGHRRGNQRSRRPWRQSDSEDSETETMSTEEDDSVSQWRSRAVRGNSGRPRPELADDLNVRVLRLQPSRKVGVRPRDRRGRYRGGRGRKNGRRDHLHSPRVYVQDGEMRDEPSAAVGGKIGLGLGELLPDMDSLLPHFRGNLQVGPKINIRWNLGELLGLGVEWWKGPNVCQSEYQTETNSSGSSDISRHGVMSQTQCDNTDTTYTCTTILSVFGNKKTFVTTYECCHGYQRVPGESGCTEVLHLTDLISTAEKLNLTQFIDAVTSIGLEGMLQRGNFTAFVPLNEAFESIIPKEVNDYSDDYDMLEITPEVMNFAQDLDSLLHSHLVEDFYKSSRLEDEMILDTGNPKAKIRINKYEVPKRLVTANCQPVVSLDNQATNGVIHVVSGILNPVEKSLLEIVSKDPELSTLKTLLAKTGLSAVLSDIPGQFTLFAPTNAAFSNVDPRKLDRLLGSSKCLTNVLKHHLVENVICTSILQSDVRTRESLNGFLYFNQSGPNLLVDDALITQRDQMGTNGVLHKIDKVLIPHEAFGVLDIAEKLGATDFVELLGEAALTKTLETEENITVFVPTNEAIQSLPATALASLQGDPVALGKVLKFHVVPSVVSGRGLCDGRELDTLDSSKTISIKDYSSFPFSSRQVKTVQCAPVNVKAVNIKACNGIIHMIDKVMLPPQGDVLDVLSLDSRFSTLVNLLKNSGIAEDLQLSGPFTFFAPTNEAFEKLPDDVIAGLSQGTMVQNLKKILQHHLMHDTLCCAGIMAPHFFTSPRERMLDGSTVILTRNHNGDAVINNVPVSSCDITATNGVIHAIDDLIPEAIQKYTRNMMNDSPRSGQRSRLGRMLGMVNRRVGRLRQHMDNFEWEFEWPDWMKRRI